MKLKWYSLPWVLSLFCSTLMLQKMLSYSQYWNKIQLALICEVEESVILYLFQETLCWLVLSDCNNGYFVYWLRFPWSSVEWPQLPEPMLLALSMLPFWKPMLGVFYSVFGGSRSGFQCLLLDLISRPIIKVVIFLLLQFIEFIFAFLLNFLRDLTQKEILLNHCSFLLVR